MIPRLYLTLKNNLSDQLNSGDLYFLFTQTTLILKCPSIRKGRKLWSLFPCILATQTLISEPPLLPTTTPHPLAILTRTTDQLDALSPEGRAVEHCISGVV